MAIDYAALATTATTLLTENGMELQIHRTGEAAEWTKMFDVEGHEFWTNAVSGAIVYTAPSGSAAIYTGYGVISAWPKEMIDGSTVQVDDVRVVISIDVEIENGDVLVTPAGKQFTIVPPVRKVAPTESPVLVQEINARA